jgi:Tfp pilus assembly protein PilO
MSSTHKHRRLFRLSLTIHVLCAIAVGAGVVAGRRSFLNPVVTEQRIVRQRMTQLNKLLASSSEVTARHAELVTSLQDIRLRDEEVRRRIPDESREDEFLEMMTSKAIARDIRVTDYRRQQIVDRESYNELGITIACTGEFAPVCGLLYDLTTLPRVTHVKRMAIGTSNNGTYDIALTLALFFGADEPTNEAVAQN